MARFDSGVYFDSGARYDEEEPVAARERTGRMIRISRLFEIIFEDEKISFGEFYNFSKDHLARMKALDAAGQPNAGRYTALIAATQPLFDIFELHMSGRLAEQATQEGATVIRDGAIKAFKSAVSQQEGLIRAKFGRTSGPYQEFFPLGVTQYSNATLETVKALMDNFVNKAQTHQAALGADFLAQFTALRGAFAGAQEVQAQRKGAVEGMIEQRKGSRAALERQTMLNIYALAAMHVGEPERANDYFDQTKLEERESAEPEEPPPPPPTA